MITVGLRTLARREIVRYFVVFSQTLLPPLVSSTLFLFVFGCSIGSRIEVDLGGSSYLEFLVPGLVMMHLIESSYANASSSLFISRWHNHIQELLLSPLSYAEMVCGYLAGAVSRGLIVGTGVYLISMLFVRTGVAHPMWVLYFALTVTVIFASAGLLTALWADGFEKLSFWGTFVLSPLIYFGGVFHSVSMVPDALRPLSYANPVFYLISGLRYGLIGGSDVPVGISAGVAGGLAVVLVGIVTSLFRAGWRIRS